MGLYHQELHIRRGGTGISHNLYTSLSEAGGNALCLRDGGNVPYAALGSTGDANASPLRVRKGSSVYAALKEVATAPPPTPFARVSLPAYENIHFIKPSGELPKQVRLCKDSCKCILYGACLQERWLSAGILCGR